MLEAGIFANPSRMMFSCTLRDGSCLSPNPLFDSVTWYCHLK